MSDSEPPFHAYIRGTSNVLKSLCSQYSSYQLSDPQTSSHPVKPSRLLQAIVAGLLSGSKSQIADVDVPEANAYVPLYPPAARTKYEDSILDKTSSYLFEKLTSRSLKHPNVIFEARLRPLDALLLKMRLYATGRPVTFCYNYLPTPERIPLTLILRQHANLFGIEMVDLRNFRFRTPRLTSRLPSTSPTSDSILPAAANGENVGTEEPISPIYQKLCDYGPLLLSPFDPIYLRLEYYENGLALTAAPRREYLLQKHERPDMSFIPKFITHPFAHLASSRAAGLKVQMKQLPMTITMPSTEQTSASTISTLENPSLARFPLPAVNMELSPLVQKSQVQGQGHSDLLKHVQEHLPVSPKRRSLFRKSAPELAEELSVSDQSGLRWAASRYSRTDNNCQHFVHAVMHWWHARPLD